MINTLPGGVYPDVAANGLDVFNILNNGDFQIIYPRNGGREALYIWLLAPILAINPVYWMMYVFSAIVGTITLVVNYFVYKNMFGAKIGIISTAFLAVSYYHVHYSRLGYRTIITPLIVLLVYYAFYRLSKNSTLKNSIVLGSTTGVSLYTYLSMRAFAIAVFASLAAYLFLNRKKIQNKIKIYAAFATSFLVTSIPIIIASISDPNASFTRSKDVLETNIIDGIISTIKIFGISGDYKNQYNVNDLPLLSPILTIFFIAGIVYLVKNYFREIHFWFVTLTISSQLAIVAITDSAPHLLRSVSINAVIYLVVAFGIIYLYQIISSLKTLVYIGKYKLVSIAYILLVAMLFINTLVLTHINYFIDWANIDGIEKTEFALDYVDLGNYLSKTPIENVSVLANTPGSNPVTFDWYSMQTLEYILKSNNYNFKNLQLNCSQNCIVDSWIENADTIVLDPEKLADFYIIKSSDTNGISDLLEIDSSFALQDIVYSSKYNDEIWYVYGKTDISER